MRAVDIALNLVFVVGYAYRVQILYSQPQI